MFYVDPVVKTKFDSLPVELKDAISEKNVKLNSMNDLIKILEEIASQHES